MEEEIAEIVRKYGWYAANVSDAEPPFLYTIGLLESWQHPELILFGLDAENAYALLAGLISNIQHGHSYAENAIQTIELGEDRHQVGFRCVHSTQHPVYLGFAMGYQRHLGRPGELSAMQVFWPDEKGRFPFDPGCELDVYQLQPRLDIGLTPREVQEFERQWE